MTARRFLSALGALLLTTLLLLCLLWLAVNLPLPVSGQRSGETLLQSGRAARFFETRRAEALSELTYIRKVYTLPANATMGPAPDPNGYGAAEDSAALEAVVRRAEESLGELELVWDVSEAAEGTLLRYYCDESILAIAWQEKHLPATLTFCEVVIGDASQLIRKLSEDTYGSAILRNPTDLAKECRAVVAVNGDFYRYRSYGINVYHGVLYRTNGKDADTCFFDESGNMLLSAAGELTEEAEVRRYIAENHIVTGISFGPIMVKEGVNCTPAYYPIGEYRDKLARCCIGQVGPRHYLLAAVDYYYSVSDMADLLISRGVVSAYNVDGGQSGAIILNGEQLNPNIFQAERAQSDILAFVTAIPEEG